MKIKYTQDNEDMLKDLSAIGQKTLNALLLYSETQALKLRSYMQINRPWTDRSGEAKKRLNAEASLKNEHTVRITLSHGVNYGVWLELANNQKYAIIQPTLNLKSPEVLEGVQNLMDKIK